MFPTSCFGPGTNKQTIKQQPENDINNSFFIISLECKVETLNHMNFEDQK